ncbi:hypothetical protein SLS62_010016 [Diatrype stigma]|uniref:Uncharacterized protein n=1 Tax=Diatrype stigma TaxID=117547 RepID=A0AAN9YH95_9PEZI
MYAIPYLSHQRPFVGELGKLQTSLAAEHLPKTLQNINCLWQRPLKAERCDRKDGGGTCFVRLEDKRQYVDVLQNDVRLPPLSLKTHHYNDAVAYRGCIYRELTKGPEAYWYSPKFPIYIPQPCRIINDTGEALEQGVCAQDLKKLGDIARVNEHNILTGGYYGIRTDLVNIVDTAFRDEIRARIAYIDGFLLCNDDRPNEGAATVSHFYPWLGPNVEFDCWLFQREIVRQWEAKPDKSNNKDYRPERDIFVRMYGLGRKDLEYLLNNAVADERAEQIATIERFHSLQAVLGREPTADIRGQFSFCSYAIRNSRLPILEPRWKIGRGLAEDRKREFKIAKVLVDRVWEDVESRKTRALAMQLRHPQNGDWNKLGLARQKELLGNNEELISRFIFRRSTRRSRS